MKHQHQHDADFHLTVDIPTHDLEDLIDKAVDAAVIIITTYTAAQIVKSYLSK